MEGKYYMMHDFARPLREDEVSDLEDMFASRGWKVFMSLRKEELTTSIGKGMDLTVSEEVRTQHRALYHGLLSDLTFANRLNGALKESPKMVDSEEMSKIVNKGIDIFDHI